MFFSFLNHLKDLKNVLLKTPPENFFTSMAVRVLPDKTQDLNLTIKITFTDLSESYLLSIKNSVLHHHKAAKDAKADATLTITRALFVDLIVGEAGLKETLFNDDLSIEGSKLDLVRFFSVFDKPEGTFNIVTP